MVGWRDRERLLLLCLPLPLLVALGVACSASSAAEAPLLLPRRTVEGGAAAERERGAEGVVALLPAVRSCCAEAAEEVEATEEALVDLRVVVVGGNGGEDEVREEGAILSQRALVCRSKRGRRGGGVL